MPTGTLDRPCERPRGQLGDLLGQRAAVGVAEHDRARAGFGRGADRLTRIFGIGLPAVEEVLGIVDDFAAWLCRNATLSAIMARFSSSDTRRTSVT